MNQNEKTVLNNLLNRIDESSYPELEKMFNTSINELNETHIGGLLTIFNREINIGKAATDEIIRETLINIDYISDAQIEYNLMQIELNNYNLRELESFIDTQINLLNNQNNNQKKKKIKAKKEFI